MNGVRYLTLSELLQIYEAVIEASGGSPGIADLGLIESALARPRATFGDQDLYSDVVMRFFSAKVIRTFLVLTCIVAALVFGYIGFILALSSLFH